MTIETSNYKLKKIDKNEAILDTLNNISNNMDIIDEALGKKLEEEDLPKEVEIPQNTSDLNNDSNFISSTTVTAFWSGTQAEYDAITTKDATTLYLITEE